MSLEIRKLRRQIADFTLEADFRLERGERAGLVGRSGSGKTSLLRMIAGLESCEGNVILEGSDISRLPPQKRDIGFVFQDHALFPSMSVLENLVFGLKMRGVPADERVPTGMQWLEKVDLKTRADDPVTVLSGGESQRVAFARALIIRPKLLLLDEPFSSVDADLRVSLRNELRDLHRLWPVPLILVSHDERDIEDLAQLRLQFSFDPSSFVRAVRRA